MVTFFYRLNNYFFWENTAGKPDGFLVHAKSVLGTSLFCSLYMLCLFTGKCCLVRCILLTLQRCNPTKSQCPSMSVYVRLAEKNCAATTICLFPVRFCGGYRGLFYNLYKYNTYIFFPLKVSTIILSIINVVNIPSISSTNRDAQIWKYI
ncbi:hypothetical protein C802_03709 [Phocaeicola sartorii]|uniref:Uncharacterized protein n=1 Tax=Phocaeicola sartorii TaxID=671267 RepID=R9I0L3_9BACT|nr:hypothetical protein C802_03709 [Phocaeicola sartorii]